MRKNERLLLMAAVLFAACNSPYKKGVDGMEYKIIADGKGKNLKPGEFVEFHFTSVYNNGNKDSILNSTRDMGGAQIITFDLTNLPPAYFNLFKQLKKGDSLSTKILSDTVFKKQPEAMPPFMAKGTYLYTNIRIINVYKTQEEADKARQANMAALEILGKKKAAELAKPQNILTFSGAINRDNPRHRDNFMTVKFTENLDSFYTNGVYSIGRNQQYFGTNGVWKPLYFIGDGRAGRRFSFKKDYRKSSYLVNEEIIITEDKTTCVIFLEETLHIQ